MNIQETRTDFERGRKTKYMSDHKQFLNREIFHLCNPCWQNDDIGCKDDNDATVDDIALDHFINRILFRATISDNIDDAQVTASSNPEDGEITKIFYADRQDSKTRPSSRERSQQTHRKLKNDVKKSEMKAEDNVCDTVTSNRQKENKEPFICMPLRLYRKLVNAEIETKVQEMYEYFEVQTSKLEESRIEALKNYYLYQDKLNECKRSMDFACAAIRNIHDSCRDLQHEVAVQKGVKQRCRPSHKFDHTRPTKSNTV